MPVDLSNFASLNDIDNENCAGQHQAKGPADLMNLEPPAPRFWRRSRECPNLRTNLLASSSWDRRSALSCETTRDRRRDHFRRSHVPLTESL